MSADPETGPSKRPYGTVVASAVDAFRTLVYQHIELAKAQAVEALSAYARGAGMVAGAAVLVLFAIGYLAASIAAALGLVMPAWAANLLLALLLVAGAGVLVLLGRRSIRTAPTMDRTRESLKEDARWAQQQIAR